MKTLLNLSLARSVACGFVSVPLLVACGGGGGGGDTPVPTPVPAVTTAVAGAAKFGQPLLLTLTGTNLDQPITVSSAGCTTIARSTTAPNVSTASTAYYTCTVSGIGAQQFAITRNADNTSIGTAAYTVAVPAVTTAVASAPKYGQPILLTVNGTNLDEAMTVSSAGCTTITRSTTAPNISSATTAYYGCTVSGVGPQQFAITRNADNASIGTAAYTVPVPQVTMVVSNGAAVSGTFVITLAPQQAPLTVNNFLAYVNSGFYNNSIFHRLVTNFVLQAGGYDAGVTTAARPVHKPVNAAIALEDNVGLSNTRLTVAMARTGVSDSATSEFFINLVDNLFLNRTSDTARGYAVFGSVTAGADVITSMTTAPCVLAPLISSECLPIPNLVITSAVQNQ